MYPAGAAAHIQTPIMAMGVRSALADAPAPSRALAVYLDGHCSITEGPQNCEAEWLKSSQAMVESGQRFSGDFAEATNAAAIIPK